ncbi:hypothetical protein L7F22_048485 [Adiantum nelumboides]|nr:hypothetical protein [Adiantum nelumboides]
MSSMNDHAASILERKVPTLPSIPSDQKLDGKNYSLWKAMMEAVLESYDLLEMVSDDFPRPVANAADTLEERTQINKAAVAWDKLNARVRSFLFLSCTPQALGHVKHITSAREIWLYFNTMYNRVTPMKLAGMEIQIKNLDLKQSSSVKEHIDRLQLLHQEAGKKFSSEEMAIVLLGQIWLLPRFSVFYTSLLTSGCTTPMTWEELVPLVLAQDDQHQLMKKGSSEALAGQTNSKPKGKGKETPSQSAKAPEKGKKPSSKKEKTCFECGKSRHFRKDCPDKTEAKEDSDKIAVVAQSGAFVHLEVVEEGSSSQELACASGPICEWIVDSGASRHMTPSKDGLQHLRSMQGKIFIGDNSTIPIQDIGSLPLIPDGKGGSHSSEVLYAPHLGYHLLSVSKLCQLGLTVEFDEHSFTVCDKQSRKAICEGFEQNGIYRLKDIKALSAHLLLSVGELWHTRFGHLNYTYLRQAFRKDMVIGLPDVGVQTSPCSSCLKGKQHRDPFPKQVSQRATQSLDLVHMDLCGPMLQTSLGGSSYFMLIVDDFSRLTWIFPLHQKG